MENKHHSPIILPVGDLKASSSFYLSALHPLSYQLISEHKRQSGKLDSRSVDLGPVNTNRVDVVLSPIENVPNSRKERKASHLIFPAASRIAVRQFYTAALNAGGRIVSPPSTIDDGAEFSATVVDLDGNEIQVGYTDPTSRASPFPTGSITTNPPTSSFIEHWREAVADQITSRDVQSVRSGGGTLAKVPSPTNSQAQPRRASVSSSKKSVTGSKGPGSTSNKNLVGTILGAAAGAAVVFALAQEYEDSKAKEAKFIDNMEARRRLRAEAKARAIATEWREKARNSRRRNSLADRDSGYYSRRTPSPDVIRYRTITYEIPEARSRDTLSRTSSRTATRNVEPAPTKSSPGKVSRTSSVRSKPITHVTVTSPPSRPPRPSPPNGQRTERSVSSKTKRDDDFVRPPSREQNKSGTTRTIRYPVRSPSDSSKSRSNQFRQAMPPPPPQSSHETPHTRPPDEYIDQLDLDDETVVPDDSISCVSSNAGPQHRARKPNALKNNNNNNNATAGRRRKMGVAY